MARAVMFSALVVVLSACSTAPSLWGDGTARPTAPIKTFDIEPGMHIRVEGEPNPVEILDIYTAASNETCLNYVAPAYGHRVACLVRDNVFARVGADLTGRATTPAAAKYSSAHEYDSLHAPAPLAPVNAISLSDSVPAAAQTPTTEAATSKTTTTSTTSIRHAPLSDFWDDEPALQEGGQ